MTTNVNKLADKIIAHIDRDGYDDTLLRWLFNRCGASDADITDAMQLAKNKLRDQAQARFDHANALAAYWKERPQGLVGLAQACRYKQANRHPSSYCDELN